MFPLLEAAQSWQSGRGRGGERSRAVASVVAALIGLTVAGVLVAVGATVSRDSDRPRHLLLVTLDTTRADALGCYGNSRDVTPTIDGLARQGILFDRAYSSAPITAPSHATILTGSYPFAHGVRDNGDFVLPAANETLAEILEERGFQTVAVVGAFPLDRRFGLDQGFTTYDDDLPGPPPVPRALASLLFDERPADWVNESFFRWLDDRDDRPFFAWLHYFDAHQPHAPPSPFADRFADFPYLGEVAFVDASLRTVLARLETEGLADETLVVVTADHGEGLGEHEELTHSQLLYDSTLRVPLILHGPGLGAPRVVSDWVGTVDILPTVLDVLGFEVPPHVQGVSLARATEGRPLAGRRLPLYAETLVPRLSNGWGELRAVFESPYKLIHGPRPELYDLHEDPRELRDLGADSTLGAGMERRLRRLLAQGTTGRTADAIDVDPEVRERMAALGYLGGGESPRIESETLRRDGIAPQDRAADLSRWSRSRQLVAQGRASEALGEIGPLLQSDPTNPRYLEIAIVAASEALELETALRRFRTLRAVHPEEVSSVMVVDVARRVRRSGRNEAARDLLEWVREEADASWFYELALVERADGRTEAMAHALERSLALDDGFVPSLTTLASLEAAAGERSVAERRLLRAIELEPFYPRAWFNLGVLQLETGRAGDAAESFRSALQLDPSYDAARKALDSVEQALVTAGQEWQGG